MLARLSDGELRLMLIVWEREPLGSGQLVKYCAEQLGWKKSTTYTVIKHLEKKQVLQNENACITSLVSQEEVQRQESRLVLKQRFGGSLPSFLTAFLDRTKLTQEEAEQLKALIDRYKES